MFSQILLKSMYLMKSVMINTVLNYVSLQNKAGSHSGTVHSLSSSGTSQAYKCTVNHLLNPYSAVFLASWLTWLGECSSVFHTYTTFTFWLSSVTDWVTVALGVSVMSMCERQSLYVSMQVSGLSSNYYIQQWTKWLCAMANCYSSVSSTSSRQWRSSDKSTVHVPIIKHHNIIS